MTFRMPPRAVYRFAPSPNGPLHLGHALSALTGFEMARRSNGRFLVRIEDIDVVRCRPELVAQVFDDLSWLGIGWEQPVMHQSQRFDVYAAAAAKLRAEGLLYPCFATRAEVHAAAVPGVTDPDGAPLYPGLHRHLSHDDIEARIAAGQSFALRIDMQRAVTRALEILDGAPLTFTEFGEDGAREVLSANAEAWGDAVIVRKDVPASYHLAVVVDDAAQGVTHVARGRDLFHATGLHRLLQVLLRLPEPLYHHHRLLTDGEGRKLAKSAGDIGLAALRTQGVTAAEVRRMCGF
ncbi:tRNA glutamyl-Q(34) synthetase GluQRS [Hyphomicrobium sulfonivorans]|uniref:tRNA glutamyl-Q(34) synthetase GluQRS n=1 Tax=Hyphomicrobium sulfonivorans TaxID=121290 RepID=UPI003B846C9E